MSHLPDILELDSEHCLATYRGLVVQCWKLTRAEAVQRARVAVEQLRRRDPGPVAVLIIIEPDSPLPDAEARRELDALGAVLARDCRVVGYVYQGTGFAAAAIRALMLALMAITGQKVPTRTFATVPQALSYMAPHLEEARFGSAAERARAVADIQARFAEALRG